MTSMSSVVGSVVRIASFVVIAAVSAASVAWGQGFTAVVLGTVTDSSGAVLPGVTITVTNVGTGQARTLVSDGRGTYQALQLPPGQYTVAAEIQGFRRVVREDIRLQVDQRQQLDFKLELGQVSENVTVVGEAAQIQTETATVGAVITAQQAQDLPLNGRNFLQLNLLVPGAVPTVRTSVLATQGGGIVVHGLPDNQNSYWVDGMDNVSQAIGQYVVNMPQTAIQEFRVMSPAYDAEFGRTAGAQINLITRSGANTFHGDASLFVRDSMFDAKNFFDPPGEIPEYNRKQFGGSLGGPIIRGKTFFFAAWDGQRQKYGMSAAAVVPSTRNVKGDFSDISAIIRDPLTGLPFPGNVIPQDRLNATGLEIAAFYPAPNGGPNTVLVSPIGTNDDDVMVLKIDQAFGPKNQLSFRAVHERINYRDPIARYQNVTNNPGFGLYNLHDHKTTLGFSDTHMFSPSVVSEVRVGWNRWPLQYTAQTNDTDYCTEFAIQGCNPGRRNWGFPPTSLNNVYAQLGGSPSTQNGPFDTMFIAPTMTVVRGEHTMKFGWDYHHFTSNYATQIGPGGAFIFQNGRWSGNALADLLLGLPYQATMQNFPDNDPSFLFDASQTAGFFQDTIRLTSELTLTAGLRYEVQLPATEEKNRLSNYDEQTRTLRLAGVGGESAKLYEHDKSMWAPRIGVAWSPDEQTAIRGGYGLFYQLYPITTPLTMRQNVPFFNRYTIVGDGRTITVNNAFTTGLVANVPAVNGVQRELQQGRVQQFSLGVQREIFQGVVADVGYVGHRASRLIGPVQINAPLPGPGAVQPRRPNSAYAGINIQKPAYHSQYDGLEVRVEKRLSNGTNFLMSYTLSETLGDATPQNPLDLDASWGPSGTDVTQHLAFSYGYALPFGRGRRFLTDANGLVDGLLGGWQLRGVIQASSGQALTPLLGIDNTNTQLNLDRPDLVGDPYASTATCQTGTPACWFNAAAFATPAPFTFGNAETGSLRGPGYFSWDFSLAKTQPIGQQRLELRWEVFNLTNRVNFENPTLTVVSNFGRITTAKASRQMQFAFRFLF
jgi:hypothetical protein